MKTITIYTVRNEDHYKLGTPAKHLLEEPANLSRTWIERAEYVLPDGYHAGHTVYGEPSIYRDDNGQHCDLTDSEYYGRGGGIPTIIDTNARPWYIKLDKVRDLPW